MSGAAKNLIIILGLATVAFAGYFLYQQQATALLAPNATSQTEVEAMLMKTQVFIARRQALDSVRIDDSFFENEIFLSLQSYTRPLENMPVGRTNPFDPIGGGAAYVPAVETE